jgi:hypothetical protein
MTYPTRTLVVIATAVAALGGVVGGVAASIGPPRIAATGYSLRAQLDPSQMVPAPAAPVPASGRFEALLAHAPVYARPPLGRSIKIVWRLAWRLTVSNLTGPVTRVQINRGVKGQVGVTLVILCDPCSAIPRGSVNVTASEAKALLSNRTYVSAATTANSGGEVRGQITRFRLKAPTANP